MTMPVAVAAGDARYARVTEALQDVQKWYEAGSPEDALRLRRLTMELGADMPHRAGQICRALIQALAQGMKPSKPGVSNVEGGHPRGNVIEVGGMTFESRTDYKARCQQILHHYAVEARLEEADDKFMRCVLQHHPRGKTKLNGCQGFTVGLHSEHQGRCFYVIRNLDREDFSYVRCVDNTPTYEIMHQRRLCDILCDMLQMHPAFGLQIAQLVEESFPSYRGKAATVERHRNWTNSILELCERKPELTEFLLRVLVRRMVEMDTEIQKIEGEVKAEDEAGAQLEEIADILDAKMLKLFEYLQRHLTAPEAGNSENRLASAMFRIFESVVLLTHQSRCVQFLWFYLASLRPSWSEAFLTLLLHTTFSEDQALSKRLIALGYLSSFIARSKFLTKTFTLRTAQYVATLARENQQMAEVRMSHGDMQHHHVLILLYAVQALCYILCFHTEDFATKDPGELHTALHVLLHEGAKEVGAEAFALVMDSALNPIARINKQVGEQVCACLKAHSPALVAILEQRLEDKNVKGASYQINEAGLEVFFPFDPYRLRHSSMFVASIYRSWSSGGEEDEESNMDPGDADGFGRSMVMNAREQGTGIDDDSDVDFTDARDAKERGFDPAIQPSPAFRPRGTTDMMDVSPFLMPMLGSTDEEDFALPSACVPIDAGPSVVPPAGPSSMLCNLLGSAAFREGQEGPSVIRT